MFEYYGGGRKYMAFIDLQKAYDEVLREVLWRCLKAKSVLVAYTRSIKDVYNESMSWVIIGGGGGTRSTFPY